MGVSLGLVGLGSFGSQFAALFKSHPLTDRVALCDREPDRIRKFAEKESFQDKFKESDAYTDFEELLDSDVDAVVIITQPWLHAPQAVAAMERGKHVYSAVPIISVPDADEILDWCDRIIETSRRTGCRYMLGETTYYRPQTMFCRRKTAGKEFGRFVYAEGAYYHDVDSPNCSLREVQQHRTSSSSGEEWKRRAEEYRKRGVKTGPMHYPTHSVSGPISIMNAHAVKVSCFGVTPPEGDDYFAGTAFADETAVFSMSNGATMRINEFRLCACPGLEMFSVMGDKATFIGREGKWGHSQWMTRSDAETLEDERMRDSLPEEVYEAFANLDTAGGVYGGHGGSHAFLVHEFVSAVAEGRQPAVNAWEAVRYMAAGASAHKSALRDGEVLDVPDWGDAPE